MRSKGRIAALVAVATALGAAAPAEAGSASSKPTSVVFTGSGYVGTAEGGIASAQGHLDAAKRCLDNRTVKVYVFVGQTKRLLDVDRSSRNGSWSVRGRTPSNPDGYEAVAERAKRGKVVCREGSVAT